MDNDVIRYYSSQIDEDGRMLRNKLEFTRNKEIISRFLTRPGMRIADIGGASGVYSYWLAQQGHAVDLLDFTERHILQAREKSASYGLELASYTCADARHLPYGDGVYDIVLMMGPLYHLQSREDRIQCLSEASRTLKSGGVILCNIISRFASLIDGFKYSLVKDPAFVRIMEADLATGKHDNPTDTEHYFTTAYFHTMDEIRAELRETGFEPIQVVAVEGFANALDTDRLLENAEIGPLLLDFLRKTECAEELLGVSGHLMAIGDKPHG